MTKPRPELVSAARPLGLFRAAVFDFDDTLSLLRSGWQKIMIEQALEVLAPLERTLSPADLRETIAAYVDDLTGLPTIHQMVRLVEEAAARGGSPLTADAYKESYTARLGQLKDQRLAAIRCGAKPPSEMMVLGAVPLLDRLAAAKLTLIIASGTDDVAVQQESALLGLHKYFAPRIFGAPEHDKSFSKGRVLDDMIRELGIRGEELVGIGDGVVEIRETRRVGGLAIGVAKWSADFPADFERHRRRLIAAGANAIIPDYESLGELLELFQIDSESCHAK